MTVVKSTVAVLDSAGVAALGWPVRLYRRDTGQLIGQTSTAMAASAPDSLYDSVVLLLPCDGTIGAPNVYDASKKKQPIAHSGVAVVEDALSANGKSINVEIASTKIRVPYSTSLDLDGTDFAIECFATDYRTSGYGTFFDFRGDSAWNTSWAIFMDSSSRAVGIWSGSASICFSAPGAIPTGTRFFLSVQRTVDGNVTIYVDGVAVSTASSFNPPACQPGGLHVGGNAVDSVGGISGRLDEVRITRSLRPTTVPASSFPTSSYAMQPGNYAIETEYVGEVDVVVVNEESTFFHDKIIRTTMS